MNENIDVNNADAIFIPSNLSGDRTDYTEYKTVFYKVVPPNCVLIKKNKLTGRLSVSNRSGLHLMNPLITESIFLPIIDRTIDYPKADYLTTDNIKANVDIVLKVRVSDPIKYLQYGKYQMSNLNTLTQNLLRTYIRARKYDDLSSGRISLGEFAPALPGQNGGVAASAYQDFEERYGIRIESVQLKAINLPPEMQKLYDDEKEEEKKKAAQKIRLEAETEKAQAEARMMDIRTEAEARRASQLAGAPIQGLRAAGISDSAISQNVGAFAAKNSVFIGGNGNGNDTAKSVAAGIAAGQAATRQDNSNSSGNRINDLVNLVRYAMMSPNVSEEHISVYENFLNSLSTNQELISLINGFSDAQFDLICNNVLSGEFGRYGNSFGDGRSRSR